MSKVDSTLTRNDTTQAQLMRHTELIKFMQIHCHERAYSFQVRYKNFILNIDNYEFIIYYLLFYRLKNARMHHVIFVNQYASPKLFLMVYISYLIQFRHKVYLLYYNYISFAFIIFIL